MIKRYNNLSLALGIPGLLMQIAGRFVGNTPQQLLLGALVQLVGTVLLIVGLAFYAKAKGRSAAWGLMGLLSIIGLIVLALLKDEAPDGRVRRRADDDDDDEEDRPRRRRRRDEDEEEEPRSRRSRRDEDEDEDDRPRRRRRDEEDEEERRPERARVEDEEDEEAEAPPLPKPAAATRIVECPKCQRKLKIPSNVAGKKIKCTGCGEVFVVGG